MNRQVDDDEDDREEGDQAAEAGDERRHEHALARVRRPAARRPRLALRFTLTAFFFYFLTNIQGAFEALQPFNKLTHFTNFVVAHAHLALLGAFTILGMGVIDYIVAQIYRRPLWSRSLTEWQYWLVTIGFTGFFSVLTLAGFQQGFSWTAGIPEVNVLPQMHAYFIARGIFGAMIVVSGIVQIVNVGMTMYTNTHERRRRETLAFAEAFAPPVGGS